MLKTGNFSPIINGDINKDTLTTEAGRILFNFVTTFRTETGGMARFPSLGIARSRFATSAIDIPDPDPADTIEALVYEVRAEKFRASVAEVAHELAMAAEHSDGLAAAVDGAVSRLKNELLPIQPSRKASLSDDFQDVVDDYDCGAILPEGIDWPWPAMTTATKGLHRKEFVVIAGRPKSRKTFVAGVVAAHAVVEECARVLFISPEMPPRQVLLRFIASMCKLRYTEFKDAALDQSEELRLLEAARAYGKLGTESDEEHSLRMQDVWGVGPDHIPCFEVVQGTNKTVSWIESQIEIYRPDIVVVDSFYRLRSEGGRKNDSDWKIVTSISRELKNLAMDANVCIVGTHQMNRDAEGKIGSLGNMALADAVGQDADLILRVVTGKIEGVDRSALVVLGGREVPFDGILINNRPCFDFEEIAVITSRKQVEKLMKEEDAEEDKREKEKKAQKTKAKSKVKELAKKGARVRPEAFDPVDLVDDDEDEADEEEEGEEDEE